MSKVIQMDDRAKAANMKARSTIDGWQNILTNLGKTNKDKRTGMQANERYLLQSEVDPIYQIDDMCA